MPRTAPVSDNEFNMSTATIDEPTPAGSARAGLAKVDEAARFLAVSRAWIYGQMANKQIPYVMVGSHRRIQWAVLLKIASGN